MAVGTHILPPRYRGAKRIGHGGMGEIYRATDDTLGRAVAIKLLAERYAEDEMIRRRFTHEALAAARLSGHANTVTIFDVGDWNDRPFIVMEYLSGGSLDTVLVREGAQRPQRALRWLEQAASALDHAHENGVVHRDVKPGNLLLDRDGNVHVADFGIASAAGLDSLTVTGTVMGTAGYISPEQAQGERATAASDNYALGVVAFELLTGERPYERESMTAEAAAHVNEPVPSACGRFSELPCELDPVFEQALAKDPAARFASGAELVEGLHRALDEAAESTAELPVAPPPRPALRGRPLPPPRRSRARWLLVLAVVACAAAVGAILAVALTSGGKDEAAAPARTVLKTVTSEGKTTTVQVTTPASSPPPTPQPPAPPPAPPPAAPSGSPTQLVDRSTGLIRAGNYAAALPVAQQALAQLRGTGQVYEAYADYNVGTSLVHTGNCADGLKYLAASQQIQGHRSEIDADRAYCKTH